MDKHKSFKDKIISNRFPRNEMSKEEIDSIIKEYKNDLVSKKRQDIINCLSVRKSEDSKIFY